jgi:hypothetical protein
MQLLAGNIRLGPELHAELMDADTAAISRPVLPESVT